MYVITTSIVLLATLLLISEFSSTFLTRIFRISKNNLSLAHGFSFFLGAFFLIDLMIYKVFNSYNVLFYFFIAIVFVSFFTFTLNLVKGKYIFNFEIFIPFIFMFVFALLSSRFRLGEQLGDNSYLTNMVTMNINTVELNTTDFINGFKYGYQYIDIYKAYLSWYHLFTLLIDLQQRLFIVLGLNFIPPYILFVWTGNLLFYYLSGSLFVYITRYLKIESKKVYLFLFIIYIYWNSIYYYSVLAHYGTNFISIVTSVLLITLLDFERFNNFGIWLVLIFIYAATSLGNIGIIVSAFLIFSFVLYEYLNDNAQVFLWIPTLLLPLIHWINILGLPYQEVILVCYGALIVLAILIYKSINIKKFLFTHKYKIVLLLVFMWLLISVLFSDKYLAYFFDFFEVKSNFDRVQDYFSFLNFEDSFRNISIYLALIGLFLNRISRKAGFMVVIILVFFINPIVYPFLYPNLQWLYHRSYVSIFNMVIVILGTWSWMSVVNQNYFKLSKFTPVIITTLLLPLTINQVTGYFHPIYEPSDDFNVILKLNNQEIEVLEKLRLIIEIEEYNNPKVISQIYATTMYVPDVYHWYFNVYSRRQFDVSTSFDSYDDIYRIFYTPVFPGDDGPRLGAPVRNTCSLIVDNRVDFIVYNKNLSVYDDQIGAWMPIYWYARNCAIVAFENDTYVLYRLFWK